MDARVTLIEKLRKLHMFLLHGSEYYFDQLLAALILSLENTIMDTFNYSISVIRYILMRFKFSVSQFTTSLEIYINHIRHRHFGI